MFCGLKTLIDVFCGVFTGGVQCAHMINTAAETGFGERRGESEQASYLVGLRAENSRSLIEITARQLPEFKEYTALEVKPDGEPISDAWKRGFTQLLVISTHRVKPLKVNPMLLSDEERRIETQASYEIALTGIVLNKIVRSAVLSATENPDSALPYIEFILGCGDKPLGNRSKTTLKAELASAVCDVTRTVIRSSSDADTMAEPERQNSLKLFTTLAQNPELLIQSGTIWTAPSIDTLVDVSNTLILANREDPTTVTQEVLRNLLAGFERLDTLAGWPKTKSHFEIYGEDYLALLEACGKNTAPAVKLLTEYINKEVTLSHITDWNVVEFLEKLSPRYIRALKRSLLPTHPKANKSSTVPDIGNDVIRKTTIKFLEEWFEKKQQLQNSLTDSVATQLQKLLSTESPEDEFGTATIELLLSVLNILLTKNDENEPFANILRTNSKKIIDKVTTRRTNNFISTFSEDKPDPQLDIFTDFEASMLLATALFTEIGLGEILYDMVKGSVESKASVRGSYSDFTKLKSSVNKAVNEILVNILDSKLFVEDSKLIRALLELSRFPSSTLYTENYIKAGDLLAANIDRFPNLITPKILIEFGWINVAIEKILEEGSTGSQVTAENTELLIQTLQNIPPKSTLTPANYYELHKFLTTIKATMQELDIDKLLKRFVNYKE